MGSTRSEKDCVASGATPFVASSVIACGPIRVVDPVRTPVPSPLSTNLTPPSLERAIMLASSFSTWGLPAVVTWIVNGRPGATVADAGLVKPGALASVFPGSTAPVAQRVAPGCGRA